MIIIIRPNLYIYIYLVGNVLLVLVSRVFHITDGNRLLSSRYHYMNGNAHEFHRLQDQTVFWQPATDEYRVRCTTVRARASSEWCAWPNYYYYYHKNTSAYLSAKNRQKQNTDIEQLIKFNLFIRVIVRRNSNSKKQTFCTYKTCKYRANGPTRKKKNEKEWKRKYFISRSLSVVHYIKKCPFCAAFPFCLLWLVLVLVC